MIKFTPGTWETADLETKIICNGKTLADLYSHHIPIVESQANARLISAAPNMYVALKELISLTYEEDPVEAGCYCTETSEGPIICGWCKAKIAIAKAEGKKIYHK